MRTGRRLPVVGAATVAAVVSAAVWALRAAVPGGAAAWERTNYAGRPVSLVEGPAWTVGALAAVGLSPWLGRPVRIGAVLATGGAALFGIVDDLAGTSEHKGLRGHLSAVASGRPTTGGLKVVGIGATSLAAAWPLLADGRAARRPGRSPRGRAADLADLADVVVSGALVAGAANLGNLLDLRPGRLLKVVLAAASIGLAGGLGRSPASAATRGARPGRVLQAAAAGASAALLPADLGERAMLGDCGANAAGALLGSALVAGTAAAPGGRGSRGASLAVVVALTLASERVSFSRVIERTPVLRQVDAAGRRPRPAVA